MRLKVLEPGDKVCFKDDHTKVATVRVKDWGKNIILLDWPHGGIGPAHIDDLLLVWSNEPVFGADNPNKTFKRS